MQTYEITGIEKLHLRIDPEVEVLRKTILARAGEVIERGVSNQTQYELAKTERNATVGFRTSLEKSRKSALTEAKNFIEKCNQQAEEFGSPVLEAEQKITGLMSVYATAQEAVRRQAEEEARKKQEELARKIREEQAAKEEAERKEKEAEAARLKAEAMKKPSLKAELNASLLQQQAEEAEAARLRAEEERRLADQQASALTIASTKKTSGARTVLVATPTDLTLLYAAHPRMVNLSARIQVINDFIEVQRGMGRTLEEIRAMLPGVTVEEQIKIGR